MDYFVSEQGNDLNIGSILEPFANGQKAADIMVPGDNCFFRGGRYNQQIEPPRAGTSGAHITFQNYQGEQAIIDGDQWQVNGGVPKNHGFLLYSNTVDRPRIEWIDIIGLTIQETRSAPIYCYGYVPGRGSVRNIGVYSCKLKEWADNPPMGEIWPPGSNQLLTHDVSGIWCRDGVAAITAMYNEISRRKYGFGPWASNLNQNGLHFRGCDGGHTILWNFIDGRIPGHEGECEEVPYQSTSKASSFGIWDGMSALPQEEGWGPNCEIGWNYVRGVYDDCVEFEGKSNNCSIHHNILDSDGGRNTFGLAAVLSGPLYIYRNLGLNARDATLKMGAWDVYDSVGQLYIYNNTFFSHPTYVPAGSPGPSSVCFGGAGGGGIIRNVRARNNIIWTQKYIVEDLVAGAMDFDYNQCYAERRGQDDCIKWAGIRMSYDDWVSLGQNIHGFYGLPGVEGAYVDEYGRWAFTQQEPHPFIVGVMMPSIPLLPDSPCVDRGEQLPGFTDGFKGIAPDIGAQESEYSGLIADFSFSPTTGHAPLTVQFTDTSLGEDITAWLWEFFDSSGNLLDISWLQNPAYTFQSADAYNVHLRIQTVDKVAETWKTVVVTEAPVPPTAVLGAYPLSGDVPLTVTFTDLSSGHHSAHIDFGDGYGLDLTPGFEIPYTYNDSGKYTAVLKVSNDYGTRSDYVMIEVSGEGPTPPSENKFILPMAIGAAALATVGIVLAVTKKGG